MRIKDLDKAETLPMRASMRKSSGYDSWETYRSSRHYSWSNGFMESHVGEDINDVYSAFRKSLANRHVSEKVFAELTDWFKSNTRVDGTYTWRYRFYVDDDGILRKSTRKHKSRDKVLNFGEPKTVYYLNNSYVKIVFKYLVRCFGYERACSMVSCGISENDHNVETNEIRRLNNLLHEDGIKPWRYSYGTLDWYELWVAHREYQFTQVLRYRSPEYCKYWYEQKDAERKRAMEMKEYIVYRFNLCEIQHKDKPFLI